MDAGAVQEILLRIATQSKFLVSLGDSCAPTPAATPHLNRTLRSDSPVQPASADSNL